MNISNPTTTTINPTTTTINPTTKRFAELFIKACIVDAVQCNKVVELRQVFDNFRLKYVYTYYIRHVTKGQAYLDWSNEDMTISNELLNEWHTWYKSTQTQPLKNPLFGFLEHTIFDKCLWALSIVSDTFQGKAPFTSDALKNQNGEFKSGFLSVANYRTVGDQAALKWFVTVYDMEKYLLSST